MRNTMFFPFFLFLLTTFLFSCGDDDELTPTLPDNFTEADLTDALETVIDESEMPGFTIAIVKNGELAYQSSFGYADIATHTLYTNQTTQPIGSISKTFIGAAIVKAVEQGHFSLETDINDLLPVQLVNPNHPDAVIKVKHLATHTSGLLDHQEAYNLAYYILPGENTNTAGAQLLMNLMGIEQREGIELEDWMAEYYLEGGDLYSLANFSDNAPGEVFHYSNLASSLAAYIIENATGQPFDEYVATHIFQPLGMMNAGYETMQKPATLYFDKATPLPRYANDSYPDGSVNVSNEDLSRYLLDLIKGVTGQSQQLFSQAGYDMLVDPLLPAGTIPSSLGENHSVFWFRGGASISHDGGDPGLGTFLQFFEDGKAGFLLLTNMDSSTDENEANFNEAVIPIFEAINAFLASEG